MIHLFTTLILQSKLVWDDGLLKKNIKTAIQRNATQQNKEEHHKKEKKFKCNHIHTD